jgi:hypothetical protein
MTMTLARAAAVVAAVGVAVAPGIAAEPGTLDAPIGTRLAVTDDSGTLVNEGAAEAIVFRRMIRVPGAAWIRAHFGNATRLAPGSRVRVTSLADGEVHALDGAGLALWRHTTGYLNGDALLLEIVAAPRSRGDRIAVVAVEVEIGGEISAGLCGPDERVPSNENWTGRLLPGGCTGCVWTETSCLVSAGHCITGKDVIEFNVPDSLPTCQIQHPPIADQFPIAAASFEEGGIGNDWAVMTTGRNNLGQTIYERYGLLRPISPEGPSLGEVDIWGFGQDPMECTRSRRQQTSSGPITEVGATHVKHEVDTMGGSSGSGLIAFGEIVAIDTHGPCPSWATRVDHPGFVAARAALCGAACPEDLDGSGAVDFPDLLAVLASWGPCPGCPEDLDMSGAVGFQDLLATLSAWGPCP